MRYFTLLVVAVTLLLPTRSSEAAPRWMEDVCFNEASQRSFNGRGEREQFVTNCIADLSAAPRRERRKYRSGWYVHR